MKIFQLAAVSLCLSVVSLSFAQGAGKKSDVVEKETTGEAAILENNRDRAIQEAKDKALREAVEQVAGVMLSAETLTENSQLVSDRIYANAAGYIRSFEIVKKEEKGGVMAVTVKAQVGRAQLDKDLQAVQALVRRLGSRRILIVTQEQSYAKDGIIRSHVLETELTKAFEKDGWKIIDPKFAGGGAMELASSITVGGTPTADKIADIKAADFIVYGTVGFRHQSPHPMTVSSNPKDPQMHFPVTGEYDLAVFSTENGAQLGKIAGKLFSPSIGNSKISYERTTFDVVKGKAPEIVGELRKGIYEGLRQLQVNGGDMKVVVVGIKDFSSAQNFVKVLRESITGVTEVAGNTKFADGKAEYGVTFVGTSTDLAGRLDGRTFKGKKVSVTKVENGGVEVSIAR